MAQKKQIVGVVKQLEAGRTAAEMAREVGVSTYTIYSWKGEVWRLEPNEATKLRHVEEENGRLKKLVAELALDKKNAKSAANKKRTELVRAARGCGVPDRKILPRPSAKPASWLREYFLRDLLVAAGHLSYSVKNFLWIAS